MSESRQQNRLTELPPELRKLSSIFSQDRRETFLGTGNVGPSTPISSGFGISLQQVPKNPVDGTVDIEAAFSAQNSAISSMQQSIEKINTDQDLIKRDLNRSVFLLLSLSGRLQNLGRGSDLDINASQQVIPQQDGGGGGLGGLLGGLAGLLGLGAAGEAIRRRLARGGPTRPPVPPATLERRPQGSSLRRNMSSLLGSMGGSALNILRAPGIMYSFGAEIIYNIHRRMLSSEIENRGRDRPRAQEFIRSFGENINILFRQNVENGMRPNQNDLNVLLRSLSTVETNIETFLISERDEETEVFLIQSINAFIQILASSSNFTHEQKTQIIATLRTNIERPEILGSSDGIIYTSTFTNNFEPRQSRPAPTSPTIPPSVDPNEPITRRPDESVRDFNARVRQQQQQLLESLRNNPPPAPITITPVTPLTEQPARPTAPLVPVIPQSTTPQISPQNQLIPENQVILPALPPSSSGYIPSTGRQVEEARNRMIQRRDRGEITESGLHSILIEGIRERRRNDLRYIVEVLNIDANDVQSLIYAPNGDLAGVQLKNGERRILPGRAREDFDRLRREQSTPTSPQQLGSAPPPPNEYGNALLAGFERRNVEGTGGVPGTMVAQAPQRVMSDATPVASPRPQTRPQIRARGNAASRTIQEQPTTRENAPLPAPSEPQTPLVTGANGVRPPGERSNVNIDPNERPGEVLGGLARRYESGNRGSAAIGRDRTGGWSYGSYQIATRTGTMQRFLSFLQRSNPELYAVLQNAGGAEGASEGTEEFKAAWRQLSQNPDFDREQHLFIRGTHYDPLANRLRELGLDLDQRSAALREVIWSTGVQHGGRTNVVERVIQRLGRPVDQISDAELIEGIYEERRTRFGSSTPAVQAAVQRRFTEESARALTMLGNEQRQQTAQPQTTAPNNMVPATPTEGAQLNLRSAEREIPRPPPPAPQQVAQMNEPPTAGSGGGGAGFTGMLNPDEVHPAPALMSEFTAAGAQPSLIRRPEEHGMGLHAWRAPHFTA